MPAEQLYPQVARNKAFKHWQLLLFHEAGFNINRYQNRRNKLPWVETMARYSEAAASILWMDPAFLLFAHQEYHEPDIIPQMRQLMPPAVARHVRRLMEPIYSLAETTAAQALATPVEELLVDPYEGRIWPSYMKLPGKKAHRMYFEWGQWEQLEALLVREISSFLEEGLQHLWQVYQHAGADAEAHWQSFKAWRTQAKHFGVSRIDLNLLICKAAESAVTVRWRAQRDLGFTWHSGQLRPPE